MNSLIIRLLIKIHDDIELLQFVRSELKSSFEIDSIWRIYAEDYKGLKPDFSKLLTETIQTKSFKTLSKSLEFLVKECTDKFGYFYGSATNKDSAKFFFESNSYDIDKSVKVITDYYRGWNNEINPKGVYNLIMSAEWNSLYNNYKENKNVDFWDK